MISSPGCVLEAHQIFLRFIFFMKVLSNLVNLDCLLLKNLRFPIFLIFETFNFLR